MSKSSITPLSSKKHMKLTYTPLPSYSFAADQTLVPLMFFEIVEASRCFPVIFPDKNSVVPYALLGFGDKNIFVDKDGHWKASYLPLMIANHPFSLIEAFVKDDADKKPEIAIGIDEGAPHFSTIDGHRLYKDDGEATDLLLNIRNSLGSQLRRHRVFQSSFDQLIQLNLLEERSITVTSGDNTRAVNGLRCVNREKFLNLPETTLGHFVQTGLMEFVYAHWHSLRHLPLLLDDPSCPKQGAS